MNEDRTCRDGGTNLTQPSSRPVRYRLIRPDGTEAGRFYSAHAAALAAGELWPGVEQRNADNGRDGWDVEVVRD